MSSKPVVMHSTMYTRLREQELAKSTRPFLAKGKSVKRCPDCQMGEFACMCPWRPSTASNVEFVLLMHRKELFKPTNTGRLIADVFADTKVFLWNRTEAPPELEAMLRDPARDCYIVFPCDGTESSKREVVRSVPNPESNAGKRTTLILLDGTWKQCSRMVGLSRWLDSTPCLSLPESLVRSYAVRDSGREHRFSTAEAAISCLLLAGEERPAGVLQHYFRVFNQHYLATRGGCAPETGESHRALKQHAS